jgi:hypothetical protein
MRKCGCRCNGCINCRNVLISVREVREIKIEVKVQREIKGRLELTIIIPGGRWSLQACELACEQPGGGWRGKSGEAREGSGLV